MRSLIPGLLIGAVSISILCAGACGGNTDSPAAAADASSDAPIRYETAPPDDDAGPAYTPLTAKCVPAPYTSPIVDPDASFSEGDAGDDDAGPTLSFPHVVSSGGPVFDQPVLIPISYSGDVLADQIEDFMGSLGCTDYWRQSVSEYGVGQAKMATPVRLTDAAPTLISDQQIQLLISKNITAGAPGFANPPDQAIFILNLPSGSNFEQEGEQSCSTGIIGYHNSFVMPGSGKDVTYGVVARCNGDVIGDATSSASHEIIEAATDPRPLIDPAYVSVDSDHIAFGLQAGSEVGDMCENSRTADFTPTGYPFSVQHIWSNASLLNGHDPCVPDPAGPYIVAIPEQPDSIPIQNTGGPPTTRGIAIPVGGMRTIDVHFHSDVPGTTWTVSARAGGVGGSATPSLTLSLDTTAATDQGIAHLTITRVSKNTTFGAETFTLRSTNAAKTNSSTWYGIVGDP